MVKGADDFSPAFFKAEVASSGFREGRSAMSRIKVAVLFGGTSDEYDISLVSAENIITAIPAEKYDVIPIGITKKGRWLFYPGTPSRIAGGDWDSHPDCSPAVISPDPMYKGIVKIVNGACSVDKVDVVLPVVYGRNGEDGRLQGLLDLSGIPYVGSGCLASAICFDKAVTHTILEASGIKTADWRLVNRADLNKLDDVCKRIGAELGFPLFVKPSCSASSSGVNKASNADELKNAVKLAFSHDRKVIVEEYIDGRELECAVFGAESPFASDVGEFIPVGGERKSGGASERLIPADIDDKTSICVRNTAIDAFKAAGCQGLAKVDFFLKDDGTVILNEINSFPSFTRISMTPGLMENMGISQSELIDKLITLCMENWQ
jgi:D-alanine-D-alanine ligase